jgi:hypothetical protein
VNQETAGERRQRGVQAAQIYALAQPLFTDREQQLVANAVGKYRAGQLDGTSALSCIAGLSEIRALREGLEHQMRQGERAAAALAEDRP